MKQNLELLAGEIVEFLATEDGIGIFIKDIANNGNSFSEIDVDGEVEQIYGRANSNLPFVLLCKNGITYRLKASKNVILVATNEKVFKNGGQTGAGGGSGDGISSIVAGEHIIVDNTDASNPIIKVKNPNVANELLKLDANAKVDKIFLDIAVEGDAGTSSPKLLDLSLAEKLFSEAKIGFEFVGTFASEAELFALDTSLYATNTIYQGLVDDGIVQKYYLYNFTSKLWIATTSPFVSGATSSTNLPYANATDPNSTYNEIEDLKTRVGGVESLVGAGSFTIETLNTTAPSTGITNGYNNQTARFKPHPSLFGGKYLILAGSVFNAYDPNINDGNFVNFSSTLPAPSLFNVYQYWTDTSGTLYTLGKPTNNAPYLPTEIRSWNGSAWVSRWNNGNGGNYPNGAVAIREDGSYLVFAPDSANQACVWTMGADFSNPVAYPLSGVSASSLTNAGIWEVGAFIVVKAGTALFRVDPATSYTTTAITLPTNFTIPQGGLCSHDGFLWSGNTNTASNGIFAYNPVDNSWTKHTVFTNFMCQCIYFDAYKQKIVALQHNTTSRTQAYATGEKNTSTGLWQFKINFEPTTDGLDVIGSPVIDTGSGYITMQITGKNSVRLVR